MPRPRFTVDERGHRLSQLPSPGPGRMTVPVRRQSLPPVIPEVTQRDASSGNSRESSTLSHQRDSNVLSHQRESNSLTHQRESNSLTHQRDSNTLSQSTQHSTEMDVESDKASRYTSSHSLT